ncbi:MAG: CPBP family intramembrane glutamic endopeptidase [Anaerolineae bacterium]
MIDADRTREPSAPPPGGALARRVAAHPLASFFALAFAGSWTAILPSLLGRTGLGVFDYALPESVGLVLYIVVAPIAGPGLAAFAVAYAQGGAAGARDLLRRCLLWRVPPLWGAIALFVFFLGFLISAGFTLGLGPVRALATQWPRLLTVFLPTTALLTIAGLFGEEPGWRGFALPRLQARFGPVVASGILGLVHGLWHLPAFFVAGALGPYAPPRFAAFVLAGIAGTLVYTWIFNHAGGSILLLTVTHAASNAASAFIGRYLVPHDPDLHGIVRTFHEQGWDNVLAFLLLAGVLLVGTLGRLGLPEDDDEAVGGGGQGAPA